MTANNAWNGYAAQSPPANPTHGGTAASQTLQAIIEKVQAEITAKELTA
jgi:hypothetical protein